MRFIIINRTGIKKIIKIAWRVLLGLLLTVYVVVALVNFSVVQSMVGSVVSARLAERTGGTVQVGSIGCNPFNHLTLRNVLMVTPEGDTVCKGHTIAMRFRSFPYDKHGLSLSQLRLKDVNYHLAIDTMGINLRYIIEAFASHEEEEEEEDDGEPSEFKVLVDDLIMDNVWYRQDLKETPGRVPDSVGVDVKHMEWQAIDARFRNVRVDLDRVTCRIDRLTTRERSGLHVKELRMNAYATRSGISATNMVLETEDSRLVGDVLLDFRDWESMGDFLDSVYFTVHFQDGSYGGMRDAAYWAHTLWGMDEQVQLSGRFSGPLQDFRAEQVRLAFGKESTVALDASIYGLPNIDTTVITADIERLHTTYADLAAVRHPQGQVMKVERIVKELDVIDLEATFAGTIYDFFATLNLKSVPGEVKGDVVLAMNPKQGEYRYVGELSSESFYLGRLAPNEWVSRTGFELNFEGSGFDPKKMDAALTGRLYHTTLRGQRLIGETAIDAEARDGHMQADMSLDDHYLALLGHGEITWRDSGPIYRASADVERMELKRFGLWKDSADEAAWVRGRAEGSYITLPEGNSMVRLSLSDLSMQTTREHRNLHQVLLTAREQHGWKNLVLQSDLVNAQMRGYFRYDGIGQLIDKFKADYLPRLDAGSVEAPDYARIADARFELNAEWVDTSGLLSVLLPQFCVARGTTVQMNYNFAESFKPIVLSDSLGWGSVRMIGVGVSGAPAADRYVARLTSEEIRVGNLRLAEQSDVVVESGQTGATLRLEWLNSGDAIGDGDIGLRMVVDTDCYRLVVDPSQLMFAGEQWQLTDRDGTIRLGDDELLVEHLSLESGTHGMTLAAMRRGTEADSVTVRLNQMPLAVATPFLPVEGMSLAGTASGRLHLGGFEQVPYLNADLMVDSLALDGEQLGSTRIRSHWDADRKRLALYVGADGGDEQSSDLMPLWAAGHVDLGGDEQAIDLKARLHQVSLRTLQPLLQSFASQVDGSVSADLAVGGTLQHPLIDGLVTLDNAALTVDMLGVPYRVNDSVKVEQNRLVLDRMRILDPTGGFATVDGTMTIGGESAPRLALRVVSPGLLCMNTTAKQSKQYYGVVKATVNGTVEGPTDDLEIVLNARTLAGSSLHIPIDDKRQVQQADYIHFTSEEDDYQYADVGQESVEMAPQPPSDGKEGSSYRLTINVEATPDLQLHLPMEFSTVDMDVKATGAGDLQMALTSESPFMLRGNYEMLGGTVLLDLLGLMSKEFSIDEGSSIALPGAISEALFDIKAVYSQRVNLSTLTGSLTATDSQKPITVENVIALSGSLQSPSISFDLRLPNADQSVQEEVFAYIDRTNERDMLNQTVSLLLRKRFYSATTTTETTNTNMAEEVYGTVANTLGSVVSDMVEVVDVNFNYNAGDALTTEQYEVDISKEWNKFYFETTLGFGGEAREMNNASGNNNMTGDMLVGYKINPRLHLFVFNRSNTNDYTRSDLPYKQGVGVKYTRDFDRWSDLFKRKKKKGAKQ